MAELTPSPETVKTISKNPVAYMLAVALILLSIFVGRSFFVDDSKENDCKANSAFWQERYDDASKQLVLVLLLQSQKDTARARYRDSAIRVTIGKQAKDILNHNKQSKP